ncbi:MAG: class 1 fructose-bisphosphatase [Cytophagales bacterium]|nr:MAG: class 1 fructose-bisphosphatase [Cytophagales bacterium]TAF61250.1 MAG: class 1 fructose-bisphosphatase [Cytophagales bacterium]
MKKLSEFLATCPFKGSQKSLQSIMLAVVEAAKSIHKDVNRGGLTDIYGSAGSQNIQGETQQKLDVIANDRLIEQLNISGEICLIASEENDDLILTNSPNSRYVFCTDPLDGSSNIDVNISIGTIFSVFERVSAVGSQPELADALQKGCKQILAGYVLYSTATVLVFTTGQSVSIFVYDEDIKEFISLQEDVKIPQSGKIYSCNEGNALTYTQGVQNYLANCKTKKYSARYIGSLVADFHRNMLKGGLFMYPSTEKDKNGKLRLLYECNPLAWLAEVAGGAASNGEVNILDIEPQQLHQRVPLFIGSKAMLQEALSFL